VIDAATNMVTAKISVGGGSQGVAVSPDGSKLYVANECDNTVSVIDAVTNMGTATITVGVNPVGVAITPDGSKSMSPTPSAVGYR